MVRAFLFLALFFALAACQRVGPDSYRGLWQMTLTLDHGGAHFALATIDGPIYVYDDGGGGVFYQCEDAGFAHCDSDPSGGATAGHYMGQLVVTFSQNNYTVLSGRDADGAVENGVIAGRGSLVDNGSPVAEGSFRFARVGDTP